MANIDNAFRVECLSIDDTCLITQGTTNPSIGAGYEAPKGSLFLQSTNGDLYIKFGLNDVDWKKIGPLPIPVSITGNSASTGILTGGALSVNGGDNTKFDLSAGVGIIVDNHTDPLNPTALLVSWPTFTAVTVTNLLTAARTFIAIDNTGNIVQKPSTPFSNTEYKNYIVIGSLGHANFTNIVGVRNAPSPAFDPAVRLGDLARAIGPFNVDGNIYSPNGTGLQISKSAGHTYRLGNNFQSNKKDTDVTVDPTETPVTFIYSWRNGIGGFTLGTATTNVSPNLWDNGSGTLQSVPNGRWTIQLVKFFAGFQGGPTTRIEYGQELFPNKSAALSKILTLVHQHNPAFSEGVLRCYLVVGQNATDLSNPSEAEFIEALKFGIGVGGTTTSVTATLQQVYDNSITPEIVTDTTRGAVTIAEGIGVGGNLIEGYNSSNILNFAVSPAGNILTTGTVDGRDVSVDGATLDALGTEVNNLETSLGSSVSGTGTWVGFTGTNYLNASTSTTDALIILDGQISLATSDQILSRHNGVITQTFSTTPTTLLFDVNVRNDSNYTYNAGVVTINVTGTYEVSFEASYVGTTNQVTTCQTSIYKNGGILAGTIAHSNHASTTSGQQTTTSTLVVSLTATDTIQIVGVRVAGTGSLVTQANGCRLNIKRLR